MRLLVTGSQVPDLPAFKRLLLVAEDVAFIDRPSVTRHRAEGRSPNASLVADGKPLWTNSTFAVVPLLGMATADGPDVMRSHRSGLSHDGQTKSGGGDGSGFV
jgi:hypothetical protein